MYCSSRCVSAPTMRRPFTKTVGAVHVELLTVCPAGVNGGTGLRAGHAGLKRIGVQPGLTRVVQHFRPGVGGRDNFLIVIDEVIHFPKSLWCLLVGATAGACRRPLPRVEL